MIFGPTSGTFGLPGAFGFESGTKYFYVGWRNDTDSKIYLSRAEASPAGVPVIRDIKAGHELSNFDAAKGTLGRPSFAMASGTDASGTVDLLGVLFVQDSDVADGSCKFQAFRVQDDGGTDRIQKWGAEREISDSTDCRFPNLFFNATTRSFMAVYAEAGELAAQQLGDTVYAEFQFDSTGAATSTGGALSPASPTEVVVTARAAMPCQLAAHYSPVKHRIGMTSIDGDCDASAHEMSFDIYKTAQ